MSPVCLSEAGIRSLTGAVSSAAVQLVAIITHATEHPRKVLARSEHADVLEIALVDVCVRKARVRRDESSRERWESVAEPAAPWQALLSSVGVKPISHSQRYPPGAFRHWPFSHRFTLSAHSSMSATEQPSAGLAHGKVTRETRTAAVARTGAGEPVSHEAVFAGAPVGAGRVDAVRVQVAVVLFPGAFVLICGSGANAA